MNGNEIRKRFLDYFARHDHAVIESSSLVPQDDPTLLFTNAGMVQFKTVFMGEDKRDYNRAVTSQRCVRAGGKHNDLENVGYTARHHTFFEMLGNFSFGDYFKKEAIDYAWEFLVDELGLPADQLWVSVFEDDDEAFELWEKIEGLPKGRIVRLDEKDNFWAMGDTGPCGPCSEIHIDQGPEAGCDRPDCAVGCDCDRFLELWNLVFMQFNRSEDGTMTPLPKPSIDTGMGLERVAAVLQGKLNNYDSDLFTPVVEALEKLSGCRYGEKGSDTTAMRVIADHCRAATFLVSDGVLPSNEGRGYVLRRVMRRAIRYGRNLGLKKLFMHTICKVVVDDMADAYPQLRDISELLEKVVTNEEERFRETLEHGLGLLDEEIERVADSSESTISGDFIFKLYDTFGFPVDIVRDISLEKGIAFDEQGFEQAMERQRAQSRASWKGENVKLKEEGVKEIEQSGERSEFTGYEHLDGETRVVAVLGEDGLAVESLAAGESGRIFVSSTPFYAESGGQVGDVGQVEWDGGSAAVSGTISPAEGIILHQVQVTNGRLSKGESVNLAVTADERRATEANHSATHLLQAAMKEVLGDHIKQAGSLVGPDRLRFDFTHFSPLSAEEIGRIEKRVMEVVLSNQELDTAFLTRDEAVAQGATALFGEKYGDEVRVVTVPGFSMELCGGTHVHSTGAIGLFKIISEAGIASGVRRIEALTGRSAYAHLQALAARENELCEALSTQADGLKDKVTTLLADNKGLEKQVMELTTRLASGGLDEIISGATDVEGIKVAAAAVPLDSAKTLREIGDKVRDSMDSGVAVLGGVVDDKVALLALVSKDLTKTIKAGEIVNRVAAIVGGKGGGRPDMAQAGGNMPDKLSEAVEAVPEIVRNLLSA
ncbi:MAG: alanine--tRNA ligase [Thermodesulfobacteriota bacterium]